MARDLYPAGKLYMAVNYSRRSFCIQEVKDNPSFRPPRPHRFPLQLLVLLAGLGIASAAHAQFISPGPPAAGRASDTGFAGLVNSTGGFSQSAPLDSNGRTAYWNDTTGTVLIRNPRASDGGTYFRPTAGISYFWGLK